MRQVANTSEAPAEGVAEGKRPWSAPKVVRHGAFREFTRGAASGSMADPMFGGAVGSGMRPM